MQLTLLTNQTPPLKTLLVGSYVSEFDEQGVEPEEGELEREHAR
jgi:hypothetical protein